MVSVADPGELTRFVLDQAKNLGFELAGVCEATPSRTLPAFMQWLEEGHHADMGYLERSLHLRSDPAGLLPGVQSIVAVGLNYHQNNPRLAGEPRIAQYALGRDYHKTIRAKLRRLSTVLQAQCSDAEVRVCVDSAPILEREYAHRAGLGWFGKNTCLINSQRGSWFLIGLLLTTVRLRPTEPAVGGCGTCRQCIDACPTGAIVHLDERWQVDARQCLSYHTIENRSDIPAEIQSRTDGWTFGCDICQEVCPFNQPRPSQPLRAQVTTEPDFLRTRAWPNLVQLAQITESDWDTLTQGSAVRRARWKGLRRNAQINLSLAKEPNV